ncbi:MAG: hypothetical protein NZ769_00005, partial [Anaerolineae bacterium]|nr:hypothetical protein [Anaerolineae bacterium]
MDLPTLGRPTSATIGIRIPDLLSGVGPAVKRQVFVAAAEPRPRKRSRLARRQPHRRRRLKSSFLGLWPSGRPSPTPSTVGADRSRPFWASGPLVGLRRPPPPSAPTEVVLSGPLALWSAFANPLHRRRRPKSSVLGLWSASADPLHRRRRPKSSFLGLWPSGRPPPTPSTVGADRSRPSWASGLLVGLRRPSVRRQRRLTPGTSAQ